MVGINPDFDYLYDPQQVLPVCLCANCGREIYAKGREFCDDCWGDDDE